MSESLWQTFTEEHPAVSWEGIADRWRQGQMLATIGAAVWTGTPGCYMMVHTATQAYTVMLDVEGAPVCECPDWKYRGGYAGFCKHIVAAWITEKS